MLLKSLRLLNFRQYKGSQNVVFATDSEKNVTVILGNNTFGKTTLLQAFSWCFYEKVNLPNKADQLNYEVADSLPNGESTDVEVEIEFTHDGRDYTLLRSQTFSKGLVGNDVHGETPIKKMSYVLSDGQTQPIRATKIDEVIKSILPEDLSSYFFFDTERVMAVSDRKDLSSSVKDLLGLSVLHNAINHLGDKGHKSSVIGKFYSSMDKDGDERAAQALKIMQDAEERREDIKKRLGECREELVEQNAKKTQYDDLLRNNGDTKSLQGKKEDLERRVAKDTKSLDDTRRALRGDFSANSLSFFITPLVEQADAFLADAEIDDKGIKDLTRPTLEEILARGTCVCGLKFSEHPDAVNHIKNEMRFCPPESIGNAVKNFRGDIARLSGDVDYILEGMNNRRANIYQTVQRIQEANDDIDGLSTQLAALPDLGAYEAARNDVKAQIRMLEKRKSDLDRDDGAQELRYENAQRQHETFSVASSKNKKIKRYIKYAEAIAQWLGETYDEKETEIREKLQDRVNEIFERMYHGHRRVLIDQNYQVKLITDLNENSRISGESEGLNRVKNFAFIAGLVSIAKEKIVAKSGDQEFDLSSEPYPLVMDAPFSNTDETHIANISKELPRASEQVIMFVMNKDWRYAEPVLKTRVGARYKMTKFSEHYSTLEEA